jgi:hypothetical protein
MINERCLVGEIESVNGTEISIKLNDNIKSNLLIIEGLTYKIGQVGSFLKIPLGYATLYGIISQTGASAIPEGLREIYANDFHSNINNRWVTISLVGEFYGGIFERGVSQYPTSGDPVHIVTNEDLHIIYGGYSEENSIDIGSISSSENLRARINLNRFLTRHSAIVGSTGSGKSNAVNMILSAISSKEYSSSRILLIDPHGEYNSSLNNQCKVYKVNSNPDEGEAELYFPYWALPMSELLSLFPSSLNDSQKDYFLSQIMKYKENSLSQFGEDISSERITVDSPIPFSLKQLWYELDCFERVTLEKNRDLDSKNKPIVLGSAEQLKSDEYPLVAIGGGSPFLNFKAQGIIRFLNSIRTRMLDTRFNFILNPGKYEPDLNGKIESDLSDMLVEWLNHDKPITILDLSSIPSEFMTMITGTLLNIVYDALYWGQNTSVGGKEQPLLIILEEAHSYLKSGSNNIASRCIQKIAKEGRKYGVGICLVSQRPSELDETVLSQCGTIIALRMNNNRDKSHISSAIQDDLKSMANILSGLKTGEALISGEAVNIPTRIRFDKCTRAVAGSDPIVSEQWRKDKPSSETYKKVVNSWRNQTII